MNWIAKFFATTGFSGYSKVAPGTIGALLMLVAYWLASPIPWLLFLSLILLLFFIGVWASTIAEHIFGHDAGKINIDEVVGMAISLFALPRIGWLVLLAFVFFRFFDISKIFPINYFQEKFSGGWGVMLDDVVAGLFTNGILQTVVFFTGVA